MIQYPLGAMCFTVKQCQKLQAVYLPSFLAKMGIITYAFLRAKRKVVLVGSFIVGAIISPTPDVFTQSMIAIPIILLYEASLWVVRYVLRR